ncbi:MAG: electron transfer flavoprotein-ubiquinone oxidoreductase [Rhizobiales bacterium]|nr:electron transfer flavoprotein-ubiquinone oxidoreductase [Hyphomicrobiales bacterium]NRB13468.1 electron transfer flavoprotein-ubiquinone oxidoreductase [Hyphomicrobiales bacterium]
MSENSGLEPRESMDVDVVIVGAGPAGLSAAIKLMQLAQKAEQQLSVVVLEKGAEVGGHILSGAVIDPISLTALIPDWQQRGAPLNVPVKKDKMYLFGHSGLLRIPNFILPPLMHNYGNYIISLGNLSRWMGEQAEALGVEIYPGFAGAEILYDENGAVKGVATGDMGIGADGKPKPSFERGMEIHAKYTLIGEGVRGSLAKQLIEKFDLDADCDVPKFGLGIKELWEIDPEMHDEGLVMHSLGWPSPANVGSGSFMYHLDNNQISIGYITDLDYANPYISPYGEFQKFKTHPAISEVLAGGKRIAYGARAITKGGYQSLPKLAFNGGILLGCAAGMVNLPRVKGTHNAIWSGIHGAQAAFDAISEGRSHDELTAYSDMVLTGPIGRDLKKIRNVKPLISRFGNYFGMLLGGFEMWLQTLLPFLGGYTLHHKKSDAQSLLPADKCKVIEYPKPDGKITFDRLSSVFLSATNHEEDQPCHLVLADASIPIDKNLAEFAEPAQRYCPAGVYEIIEKDGKPYFQINGQNCVHCKTCDIKDPAQNITWMVPEGGGGPNYPNM